GHRVRESTSHIVCLRVNIMRIYLLLITVLILGACADKQTLSQTKSEIQAESVSLETNAETVSTNEILVSEFELLYPSYEKASNLVIISYRADVAENLKIVYWDSNNNTYFRSIKLETNTNLTFWLDEQKSDNHFYFDEEKSEYGKYLGALSSNQLVYLSDLYGVELQTNIVTIDKIDDTYFRCPSGLFSNNYTFYPERLFSYTNTIDTNIRWFRSGDDLILTPYEID
ncbi:MAG: hypothetical protein ACRCV0_02530, partial [Brevinema sp.]